jgi:hypothetical protein
VARQDCAKGFSTDTAPNTNAAYPSVPLAGVAHLVCEDFDHLLSELTPESRRIEKQEGGIHATVHVDW